MIFQISYNKPALYVYVLAKRVRNPNISLDAANSGYIFFAKFNYRKKFCQWTFFDFLVENHTFAQFMEIRLSETCFWDTL